MNIDFPKTEEDTLKYWQEIDAFQTQLRLTEGHEHFTFYDGPPFGMSSPVLPIIYHGVFTNY
jgi:isoleucyl-tRNA synthetase